jgi:hypothetical protein
VIIAAWQEYIYVWHLPFIALFLVGWVVGGGFVLRWSLRRKAVEIPGRKIRLGRCIRDSFLAGLGGGFAGVVAFSLVYFIGQRMDAELVIPGAALGLVSLVMMTYLVFVAMYDMPWRRLVSAATPTVGVIVLLGGIVGVAGGVPAYYATAEKREEDVCRNHLSLIRALAERSAAYTKNRPASLQELLDKKVVTNPDLLRCPAQPGNPAGYAYVCLKPDASKKSILACDARPVHNGGRMVILLSGECQWFSEKEFQDLLNRPENKPIAGVLRAAN